MLFSARLSSPLVAATVLAGAFLVVASGSAGAATIGLRQVGTGSTSVIAPLGTPLDFELFLDTEGLNLQGYAIGVDFAGGTVSGVSVTHQSLAGLYPDFFGSPVIDEGAGTIRTINQSGFTANLAPGVYVLDVIVLTLNAFDPGSSEVTLTPGLFGETLGLGNGSCPGTVVGCTVNFSPASVSVVPEPDTAVLMALGLAGLARSGLRRRQSRAPSPGSGERGIRGVACQGSSTLSASRTTS